MTHTHHDEYAASQGFAAATWMMAMMGVIAFAALAVGLLIWAPWGNNSNSVTNDGANTEQQAPADNSSTDNGGGVDISGNDVDIDSGDVPVPGQ